MLCDSRGKNMRQFIDEDIMDDIVVISEATGGSERKSY